MPDLENPSGLSGASESAVSSGTADAAMIAAAEAASSADSAPAAKPAGDTPPSAGSGTPGAIPDATGQPVVAGQPAKPAGSGEAPERRIESAVRNARADVMTRFGLTADANPEDVRAGMRLVQALRTDMRGTLKRLSARLEPEDSGSGEEAYPEADLVSKDGQLKTYRAETFQKILDIHGRKVAQQVMQEMAPLRDFVDTETERREADDRRAYLKSAIDEVKGRPHFNEAGVHEALKAIPLEERRAMGPVAALNVAYSNFLRDKVFPGIDTAAEERVRKANLKKAAASDGSVHPAQGGGDPKKRELRNVSDLSAHLSDLAKAAQAG